MSVEKNNTKQPVQSILPADAVDKDVWEIAEQKKNKSGPKP